jgi:hypothetical protein
MFQRPKYRPSTLVVNQGTPGETLETKIEKLVTNKEPLDEGSTPLIYTPRYEGIRASTNIRTDRWEIAIDATEKIAKSYLARREENAKKGQPEQIPGSPQPNQEVTAGKTTDSMP